MDFIAYSKAEIRRLISFEMRSAVRIQTKCFGSMDGRELAFNRFDKKFDKVDGV